MNLLALFAGLVLPLLLATGVVLLISDSVLAVVAVLVFSAAFASLRPPGGGMGMHGTLRVRFLRWSWTFDRERSPREGPLGVFWLSAAVVGGFCLPMSPRIPM